jgi:UDP:flavonoid glycosyltransferase YjiC (YdhE family)
VLGKGASPAAIARAVSRVLDEPGFRQAAARLGERVRADAQEDAATSELETLAGTERTARNGAAA